MEERIREILGEGFEVKAVDVQKNNGVIKHGISIHTDGESIAPMIYYDENMSEDEIVNHVVDTYHKQRENVPDFNANIMFSRENVLANVIPVMINTSRNKEILEEALHTHLAGDIDIVYRIMINSDSIGTASVLIKNSHLKAFNLSADEVIEFANKNIKGCIKDMSDIIPVPADNVMAVITTDNQLYGASAILDENIKNEIREKFGKAYIIPSSIHELIAIPFNQFDDVWAIVNLIKQVNSTMVDAEDFLSDNLYCFDGEKLYVA